MANEGTFQVLIIVVLFGLVNFSDQADSIVRLIFSVLRDAVSVVCSFNETISESSENLCRQPDQILAHYIFHSKQK